MFANVREHVRRHIRFVANSVKSLVLGQYFWRGFRLGLRSRCSTSQAVYAKALSLAQEGRQVH